MSNKGGMDANPFGGGARLDRIDFFDFASGTDDPYKMLYIRVISDAASDYLYFGLGKNGTVADDFWYATEYFFTCRSYLPDTWKHAAFMRQAFVDEITGKRVTRTIKLSDEELKQSCFDRHYEIAGLSELMPIETFVAWLQERRREILTENKAQVDRYIDLLQRTSLARVEGGQQLPFKLEAADRVQVLTMPENPEQVAELVLYAPRYRRSNRHRSVQIRTLRKSGQEPIPRYRHVASPAGQQSFRLVA